MGGVAVQLFGSIGATLALYGGYKVVAHFYEQWTSPLNVLQGPKGQSFIWGNLRQIFDAVRFSGFPFDGNFTVTLRRKTRFYLNNGLRNTERP